MPLITCPDCNKPVSDKADKCIHCGCPLKAETALNKNDTAEKSLDEEIIFYDKRGISVSNKAVKVLNRTFNPKLITSVSVEQVKNKDKTRLQNKVLMYGLSSFFLACFALILWPDSLSDFNDKEVNRSFLLWGIAISTICAGLAAWTGWNSVQASKRAALLGPWGRIDFDTSSGRVKDVGTMNYEVACQIEQAISAMMKDIN